MEIEGKIINILPAETGQGKNGPWKKQAFVIETEGNYPKKVCIQTWGEKHNLEQYSVNSSVKVFIDIESREYNNRWYTDVKAWKIEKVGDQADHQPVPSEEPDYPLPDEDFSPQEDDLPF